MSNDFPAMIYHFVFGQKIINSEDELLKHKSDGWKTEPIGYTESEIKEKIEWHEKEKARLKFILMIEQNPDSILKNISDPDLPEMVYSDEKSEPVDVSEVRQHAKRKYTKRS